MGINQESIEIGDNETGEVVTLTVTSLVSNVRDMLLMKIRNDKAKQIWSKMNENEQAREIELAQDFARTLVQSVASIVATRNSATIRALLDNFKVKDGAVVVTAKGIADDQALVALNHVGKKALMITVVDVDQFDEVRKPAEPDPDQGTMFNHPDNDDDGPSLADAMHDAIDADENGSSGDTETETGDADDENADTDGDLQPYEQGAGAAEHGLQLSANPFSVGSDDHIHWKRGFTDWKDANDAEWNNAAPATETKEIGPVDDEETGDDESGLAEMFDAVEPSEEQADEEPGLADVVEDADAVEFDPKPFKKEGSAARMADQSQDECPYDGGTDEHAAWVSGWRSTDDEIDTLVQDGAKARRDGAGPKASPWKAGTDAHKLWMKGYNDEKAREKD